MRQASERRTSPRVKQVIPLKVSLEGSADFISNTENLGASGALFQSEKPIPLMTRLAITLLVPSLGKRKMTKKILCNGVIVRCEPVDSKNPSTKHHIAVYFTSLKDADKRYLLQFVQQKP